MPTALVIYPDTTKVPTRVTWEGNGLLRVLYRTIDTDCVDSSPQIISPWGDLVMWVADLSLLEPEPKYNDFAIGLARAYGYDVAALAGVVVITGGYTPSGETLGLSATTLAGLSAMITQAQRRLAGERDPAIAARRSGHLILTIPCLSIEHAQRFARCLDTDGVAHDPVTQAAVSLPWGGDPVFAFGVAELAYREGFAHDDAAAVAVAEALRAAGHR